MRISIAALRSVRPDRRAPRASRAVRVLLSGLALATLAAPLGAQPAPSARSAGASAAASPIVARAAGETLTEQELERMLAIAARQRFYHGSIPDERVAALRRDVVDDWIDRTLLVREAKRRGLEPDRASVERTIAEYDARYRNAPQWTATRTEAIASIRGTLERQSLVDRLSERVRQVPEPSLAEVRRYYDANPTTFTEPEQTRVSVILLRVDPSSPPATWVAAMDEAGRLAERIRAGADFAALARAHSADESAPRGGDMGYLHRGMLAEPAQAAVDHLAPGAVSGPIRLLQGAALFRLDDRKPGRLTPFERAEPRARDLMRRGRTDDAWRALLARLRADGAVSIDASRPGASAPATVAAPGQPAR